MKFVRFVLDDGHKFGTHTFSFQIFKFEKAIDNNIKRKMTTTEIVIWSVNIGLSVLLPIIFIAIHCCLEVNKPKHRKSTKDGEKIAFQNISYSVGKKKILNRISGVVKPGEICAIMGQSGAGFVFSFSSLLKTMN